MQDDEALEVWMLRHPDLGLFEVAVGRPHAVRALDPHFPRQRPRVEASVLVLRDGKPIARSDRLLDHSVSAHRPALSSDAPLETRMTAFRGWRIEILPRRGQRSARHVRLRRGLTCVFFDPTEGSAAHRRQVVWTTSTWRRALAPMLLGSSRATWALAILLVAPWIGHLVNPPIEAIAARLPRMDLPTIPTVAVPAPDMPQWIEPLRVLAPVWTALLVGVVVGLYAVFSVHRSDRLKQRWAQSHQGEGS